jgi:hypothetical protein
MATKGSPIVLKRITVLKDSDYKKTDVVKKVYGSTAGVPNKIIRSAKKEKTKKQYDKIKNGSVANSSRSTGWTTQSGGEQRRDVWKVATFKEKYKKKGSTKQRYRSWTIEYFNYYETRTGTLTYSFGDFQPSEINLTYQDLDIEDDNVGTDVGRDRKNGVIVRNRVRTNVRTIECVFPVVDHAEYARISPFLNAEYNKSGFLNLTYTDAYKGSDFTFTCYAGDRSMEAGPFGLWTNLKVTFVEK